MSVVTEVIQKVINNGSTITFDAVGDCATLVFQSGGWTLVGGFGIAVA